jgi:hypothetical protein
MPSSALRESLGRLFASPRRRRVLRRSDRNRLGAESLEARHLMAIDIPGYVPVSQGTFTGALAEQYPHAYCVPVNGSTFSGMVLEKDVHYKLVAEGQMLIRPGYWGNPSFDYHADAEYTRLEDAEPKDKTQTAAPVDVGIRVNIDGEMLPSWGPYSSEDDHRYVKDVVGTGRDFTITFGDSYHADNVNDGNLRLTVYREIGVDLAVTPIAVDEDGSQGLVYTFTRSVATSMPLLVSYAVGGTATAGSDYTGLPLGAGVKTITIPANQRTASVMVFPTADTEIEPDETVVITLQNGTGYAVGSNSFATGTIINDDLPGTVTGRGWFDANDDGVYSASESPLSGIIVNLFDSLGSPALDASLQPVGPTTVDAGATYRFPNLRPGSYTVSFTDTVGYLGPGTAGAVYAGIATVQLAQTAIVDLLFSQLVIPEEPPAPPAPPTADTLTWDDFEEVDVSRDPDPRIDAVIGWKHAYTLPGRGYDSAAVVDQQGAVKVTGKFTTSPHFRAIFDAARSWVVKGEQSPRLLTHERLHLRIAEYIAEKANLNFSETLQNITADGVGQDANLRVAQVKAKAAAVQKLLAALNDFRKEWLKKDEAIQDLYDSKTETDHSRNPDQQAKWEHDWQQRVDAELTKQGWKVQ